MTIARQVVSVLLLATIATAAATEERCHDEGTCTEVEAEAVQGTAMLQVKASGADKGVVVKMRAVHLKESRTCVSEQLQEAHLQAIRYNAALLATGGQVKSARRTAPAVDSRPWRAAKVVLHEFQTADPSTTVANPTTTVASPATTALDSFTKTTGGDVNSYCEKAYAGLDRADATSPEQCAVECLADPDCVHFMWHNGDISQAKCRLSHTCLTYDAAKAVIDGYMIKATTTPGPATVTTIAADPATTTAAAAATTAADPATTTAAAPATTTAADPATTTAAAATTVAAASTTVADPATTTAAAASTTAADPATTTAADPATTTAAAPATTTAAAPATTTAAPTDVATAAPTEAPAPVAAGATASLDAAGFQEVTSLCCPQEMEVFFIRLLEKMGLAVCSFPHIQGLMHWFSCVPAMDFGYIVDVISNGNPCKYWALVDQACPVLSEQCIGKWCR